MLKKYYITIKELNYILWKDNMEDIMFKEVSLDKIMYNRNIKFQGLNLK
jgi:hypothetical protein